MQLIITNLLFIITLIMEKKISADKITSAL